MTLESIILLAQQSAPQPSSSSKTIRIERPQSGQAVTIHLDGGARLDFSDVASEKLTFVRIGDRLIVLFDNQSTVSIDPVFDLAGHPLPAVAFDMAPDRTLSGEQFAELFPITTDQSVLPAAGSGGTGPTAGAHFGDPTVDPLTVRKPLALLGAGADLGNDFISLVSETPPTQLRATPDAASVVEAGVSPTNVSFAGAPIATGNVLTNDVIADLVGVKAVTAVGVGAGSTPSAGNLGAMLTGLYGTLLLGADGSFTYMLGNANAATGALAQGQHAADVFTYTMSDSQGHASTTTLTIDVTGTDDRPLIASGDKTAPAPTIVEALLTIGDGTAHVQSGIIHFSDVDLTDRPTATVSGQAASYLAADGHTALNLTAAELTAIEQALTVAPTAGNSNAGAIGWSYRIADGALDFLAEGETVTLASTVTVDDHHGGTDTATVTVTITGRDDVPVVTAADKTEAAAVVEAALTTGDTAPHVRTGTIHFTDVDLTDRPTAVIIGQTASYLAADGHTVRSLTPTELAAIEQALTIAAAPGNTHDGTIGWSYSIADSALDFLAQGETVALTSTITVDDHHGGTDAATVTVTITGSDDRPVITAADKAEAAAVVEAALISGDPAPHVQTGTIRFGDVDLTDRPTATVSSQTATWIAADGHTVLPLSPAELAAIEQAFTVAAANGNINNGGVNWTYSISDGVLDFLAPGETITLVSTVEVDDHHGGTDAATVTVTLTGTDDRPVLDAGVTAAVTEQDGHTLSLSPDAIPVTVHFSDPDLNNVGHTANVIAVSASGVTGGILPGILGTAELLSFFHVSGVTKAAGSVDGDINATFSAPDLAFDYLAAGEKLTITYTLKVDDHAGGSDTQAVSVTVTGTNDVPTFVAGPAAPHLAEDVHVSPAGNLHSQGTLAFADVDLSDAHTVSTSVTASWSGGATIPIPDGVLQSALSATLHDSTGTVVGSVGWSFALPDGLVQFLGQGETLTLTYDVVVTDSRFAAAMQTVTVTITGSNDAPVITSAVAAAQGSVTEAGDLPLIAEAGAGGPLHVAAALAGDGTVMSALTVLDGDLTSLPNQSDVHAAIAAIAGVSDAATAIAVVWQHLDTLYGLGGNQTNVNAAFAELGLEYAAYLKAGGSPLMDVVAKYMADGGDADTLPDRVQSLHDNLLGNLTDYALHQRYDGVGLYTVMHDMVAAQDATLLTRTPTAVGGYQTDAPGLAAVGHAYDMQHGYTTHASGQLTATDIDNNDAGHLTWSVAGTSAYGTMSIDAARGQWTYTLDDTLAATQALGAGDMVTQSFVATVTDAHGGSANQTVTVTIHGSNDAPTFTGGATAGLVSEADLVTASASLDHSAGVVTFTDADATDTHTASASYVAGSAVWSGGNASAIPAQTQADLAIALGALLTTDSNHGATGGITWTANLPDQDLDFLAVNETLTATYNVTVADGHGGAATQQVVVTFGGANDAPKITGATALGAITEDLASLGPNPAAQSSSGTISFADPDVNDIHSARFVAENNARHTDGTAYFGSFTLQLAIETGGSGSLGWQFSVNRSDIQFLAEGQVYRQFYDVTVSDGHGGTSLPRVIEVDITGTNDAPVIAILDRTESGAFIAGGGGTDALSGVIHFTDVDLTDRPAGSATVASITYRDANGQTLVLTQPQIDTIEAAFSVTNPGANTNNGEIDWNYSIADSALSFLSHGQTVTLVETVAIGDGHPGGTATSTVTVTLNGPEHPPIITSGPQSGNVTAGFSLSVPGGELVKNGGFETNYTSWSVTNQLSSDTVGGTGGTHSGSNAALLRTPGGASDVVHLSQSLATVAGVSYTIQFWVATASSPPGNFIDVLWNGAQVFAQSIPNSGGFTQVNFVPYSVTVTGTGTNSTLEFDVHNTSYIILDDISMHANLARGIETTSGQITFTDADTSDTHLVSVAPLGSNYLGTFTSVLSHDTTGSGTGGIINWTFTLADSDMQFLPLGQTTETYAVTVSDPYGGTATRNVTVNILNPDHVPVISSGPQTGAVTDGLSLPVNTGQLVTNGGFESGSNGLQGWTVAKQPGDIVELQTFPTFDGSKTLTLWTGTDAANDVIKLSRPVSGTVAGVPYTLSFWVETDSPDPNSYINVLWNNQTVLALPGIPVTGFNHYVQYSVNVLGTGTTSTLEFDFRSTPFVNIDDISMVSSVSPGTEKATGTIAFTDSDLDAHTVSVTPMAAGYLGTLTAVIGTDSIGGNPGTVNWTYAVSDSATAALGPGQSLTQIYTVTINDGHGGLTSENVSITINGGNTAPVLVAGDIVTLANEAAPGNLVQNGGFEGDLSGWITNRISDSGASHHGGVDSAATNSTNSAGGTLSQAIATTAGQQYLLDFWVAASNTSGTASESATWNGASISGVSASGLRSSQGYIEQRAVVTATGPSSTLGFILTDNSSGKSVFLDDVSLTALPSGAVGTLVSSLIASGSGPNNVSDVDPAAETGIAVAAATSSLGGTWLYSTNNGATWNVFPAVSSANVLLLAADSSTRVFFAPNASSPGSASLTFEAWDQSAGSNGGVGNPASIGVTAFSAATETATVAVGMPTAGGTVTLGSGQDSVFLLGGPNTVSATQATLNPTDRLNGAGTDTLNLDLSGPVSPFTAHFDTIGAFAGFGTVALTANPGAGVSLFFGNANIFAGQTITVDARADTTQPFTADAAAVTDGGNFVFWAGGDTNTLKGGTGNDTFVFHSADFAATDAVNGGAGTDTLWLTDTSGFVVNDAAFAGTTNIEVLKIGGGGTDVLHLGANASSAVGGPSHLLTVDDSTGTGNLTVDGAAMTANIAVITGSGAADILTGGSGNDSFAFSLAHFHGAAQSVTGGAGNDTIWITDTASITVTDADLLNVFGVETLRIAGAAADSVTLGGNASLDVGGPGHGFIVDDSAGTGPLTVDGSAMTANLMILLSGWNLAAGAHITGGAGSDTIGLVDTAGIVVTDAAFAHISGIETLQLDGSATNSVVLGATASAAVGGIGHFLTVDDSAGTGNLFLDASSMSANLRAAGSTSGDVLIGGMGNDVLTGGTGNDVLTGGAGADVFKFGEQGASHLDRILDFSNAQGDSIDISALLGAAAGAADSANVSHYLQFAKSGNDLVLQVDTSGGSTFGGGAHDVVTLAGYAVSSQHIVNVVFNSHDHQIAV